MLGSDIVAADHDTTAATDYAKHNGLVALAELQTLTASLLTIVGDLPGLSCPAGITGNVKSPIVNQTWPVAATTSKLGGCREGDRPRRAR